MAHPRTLRNQKKNGKNGKNGKTRRHVPVTMKPTINVGNYGMPTTVKQVRKTLRSPPPPGMNAITWFSNKENPAKLHRHHWVPKGHYTPKNASEAVVPVRRGNNSPGFRPTKKNKIKGLPTIRTYGFVLPSISNL